VVCQLPFAAARKSHLAVQHSVDQGLLSLSRDHDTYEQVMSRVARWLGGLAAPLTRALLGRDDCISV